MKRAMHHEQFKPSYTEHIEDAFSIPHDVLSNVPVIQMYGNCYIRIENFRCILEYREDCIKLQCYESIVCMQGRNFYISYYDKNELRMKGYIRSVNFI